jgi:uncharacterized protein YeaO (DUF488 family)
MREVGTSFAFKNCRDLRIKRFYDGPARSDGFRLLVDRLWPHGINWKRARLDHRMPEVAPRAELRKWFGYDPERCVSFAAATGPIGRQADFDR